MKKNPTWTKTMSWYVISFVIITLTGFYEFRSWKLAALTAFWASLIKTPVYTIHEHWWGRRIFSKPAPTEKPLQHFCHCCERALEVSAEAA